MARKLALFPLLVLVIPIIFVPMGPSSSYPTVSQFASPSFDPLGSSTAFNETYALMNSTSASEAVCLPGPCSSQSILSQNTTGTTSAWKIAASSPAATQAINWTVPIPNPQGRCSSCLRTLLTFEFYTPSGGRIDLGGNASYQIYNNSGQKVSGSGSSGSFTGTASGAGIPPGTGSVQAFCADPLRICFDATGLLGTSVTLEYKFGWNYTLPSKALDAQFGDIKVIAPALEPASSHQMTFTSQTSVFHNATMTGFSFNRTSITSSTVLWPNLIVTLFYPTSYQQFKVSNTTSGTVLYQNGSPAGGATAINGGVCRAADCRLFNTTFVTLDLTAVSSGPTTGQYALSITADTDNVLHSVETVVGGIVPTHWQPSETIGVKVNNTLTIKQPGGLTVSMKHIQTGTITPTSSFSNVLNGGVFNVVAPSRPFGTWNLTATFSSGYDLGRNSTDIFIEHLRLDQPSYSGDSSKITVSGTINLESTAITASSGTDVTVFAISTTTSGTYDKKYSSVSAGLYVSDVTFVNGAFSNGQTLIMYVTVTNPTSTSTLGNLTISHEILPGQLHGVNATFSLDQLDTPPIQAGSRQYELDVSFANGQMTVRMASILTSGQIVITSKGTSSPIFDTRQQFGLFNITIASQPADHSLAPVSNSIETQQFAYVFTGTLTSQGGRILAAAPTTTDSTGHFSADLVSSTLLQGRHLSFIVLARDSNGIVLGNQNPTGGSDSLILCGQITNGACQPNVTAPTQSTPGQQLSAGLKLLNNSTKLTVSLNLTLQIFSGQNQKGSSITRTATILPGQTASVDFPFTAPSELGTYTLTITSPEYGAPIYTTSMTVQSIPTWLQIAIPAIVGVAVAVGALILRGRRSAAPTTPTKPGDEKTRPAGQRPGSRNP